jgi:hypothetical protein
MIAPSTARIASAAASHLARLPAVAEEAQLAADVDVVLRVEAVEARGRRARQHGLADALDEALAEALRVGGEQQGRDAGAPVGRLGGIEHALDPGLALASDDRRREAGERAPGVLGPRRRLGRDEDARAPHAERLGERVLHLGVVEPHHAAGLASTRRAGSSSHGSRTG